MSTRRRVPTNWVSGRTLQPSIESVVANSFVPWDSLVDGQVSGLGTVHPLITISFVSTWILPLHVVSSTLKRKSSSSIMDGLQRRRTCICVCLFEMFLQLFSLTFYKLTAMEFQPHDDRSLLWDSPTRLAYRGTLCGADLIWVCTVGKHASI